MKTLIFLILLLPLTVVGGGSAAQSVPKKPVPAAPAPAVPNPFIEAAYLWTQAYDTDLGGQAGQGRGDWSAYKSTAWLNIPHLGVEVDPGWGPGDWYNCCQHVNWNAPWAKQQQRYGAALPVVILSIGQMPGDPNSNDSWEQKLAWENATWKAEAANDPTLMGYFANYAKEVDDLGFKSVIIRLGYEFDGGWNPFGNLNVMSNMPNNYIAAWRNIVAAMRQADTKHIIRGFFWNPTDGNVQIDAMAYYPGDDYTDFVGFDEYDFGYNGDYKVGTAQPTPAQQQAAWVNMELPRINRFADLARKHNKRIIVGEWGLWQLNDKWHPSGGDNPSYIQHMHDWMADPKNNVAMEVYFETPSDGDAQLWPRWNNTTQFPKAAALYRKLFGNPVKPFAPAAPSGLTAVPGFRSVTLRWRAGPSEPPATYSVYRRTKAGTVTRLAAGVAETSYVNTGLSNGVTYYYTVKAVNSAGTSTASNEAAATPAVVTNFVLNSGFETGNSNSWSLWAGSNSGAAYAENCGTALAHSGSWEYTNWSSSSYHLTLYQSMTVPNGTHTVSAWVKSSGGQAACQMEVNYNGSSQSVVSIPASGSWTQISTTVTVTGGTLQVGFYSNASANQWLNVDDVVVR